MNNVKGAENLYLTGFMGCGKTTIGFRLAKLLGRTFCDMDQELQRREGRTVSEIFEEKGESYFREKETELLRELLRTKDHIIALGGGTVIQPRNARMLLQQGARVLWLDVSAEQVFKRLKDDHSRPLLEKTRSVDEKKERITLLLEQRQAKYQRTARWKMDVNDATAEEIACCVAEKEKVDSMHHKQWNVWVLNGPNLNFLGIREPAIYGTQNYPALVNYVQEEGAKFDMKIRCLQSNHEGDLVDWLQEAYEDGVDGIVINPGALTHYSYTLRDAIASVQIPTVEVHLSEIMDRESFRHISVTKEVCIDQISGLGFGSYRAGLQKISDFLQKNS